MAAHRPAGRRRGGVTALVVAAAVVLLVGALAAFQFRPDLGFLPRALAVNDNLSADHSPTPGASAAPDPTVGPREPASPTPTVPTYDMIPGLGAWALGQLPADTRQVIVVSAPDRSETHNTVTLWERATAFSPWTEHGAALAGRNGAKGWTTDHHEGDRHSPIGVFGLTAAGGKLANPGTSLPYEYQPNYFSAGSGDMDDPLTGAFDYLVAIDYNRLPGSPPSDKTRPLGRSRGGDIWLHVDHQAATKGCVSLPRDEVADVLRWLTPAAHPVIAMGDAATLAAAQL